MGSGWDIVAEVAGAAKCVVDPHPVILDVGANVGAWASAMIKTLPNIKRIILLEPQAECQRTLKQLASSGAEILPIGLGDKNETRTMFKGEVNTVSSLHSNQRDVFNDIHFSAEEVKIRRLDDVVREMQLEIIHFMKMDIEGHELFALRGAQQCLKRGQIRAFSFEFGGSNVASRTYFKDFWDYLTPLGYNIYRVLPYGHLIHIKDYYTDLEYFRGATNYIAKHQK